MIAIESISNFGFAIFRLNLRVNLCLGRHGTDAVKNTPDGFGAIRITQARIIDIR